MVKILVSTYNGEKYLEEQIDSLINQDYNDIEIYVRDDGSKDNTLNILSQYKNIHVFFGENMGCARSFWKLLDLAGDSDYYAFCDQDDIWDSDKLSRAIDVLSNNNQNTPLLYTSSFRTINDRGALIRDFGKQIVTTIDFRSSLIKSFSPGCTFVFNKKARDLMVAYNSAFLDIHDWMACKIVSCFGTVFYDGAAHISYRQHENNVIGAQNGLKNAVNRFLRFARKSNNSRSIIASHLYDTYNLMMCEENKRITLVLANYRKTKKGKRELFKEFGSCFSFFERAVFFFLIFFEKV